MIHQDIYRLRTDYTEKFGPANPTLTKKAPVGHFSISDNLRIECPIDPNFLLCNKGVNTLLLIPNYPSKLCLTYLSTVNVWLNGLAGVAKKVSPCGFGTGNLFGDYMVTKQHPGEEIT